MSYDAPTITASGTTWAQFKTMGLTGQLEALIAAQVAASVVLSTPAQPTIAVTGGGASGGLLAAGTYFAIVTFEDIYGETVGSPESALFTVAAGDKPRLTFGAIPATAVQVNVYLTPVNGAAGTEVYYSNATSGTTVDLLLAAVASQVVPPTVNSTGWSAGITSRLRSLEQTDQYIRMADLVANFLHGNPVPIATFKSEIAHFATINAMLHTLANEVGVLVDANQGTISTVAVGLPVRGEVMRTLP